MRFTSFLFVLSLAGCPASMTPTGDAGVPLDAPPGLDAPSAVDAPGSDAPSASDAPASDAPTSDAPAIVCPPSSCGTDTCGVSSCGRSCGDCAGGEGCFMGDCVPVGTCPGTPCFDRAGDPICEGQRGLGVCSTDATRDAVCTCGGSGGDLACDACLPARTLGGRGAACETDADCAGGLPCAYPRLCGEPCDPTTDCATGECYIPGDFSGVCLDACACDVPGTCAAGQRCVDGLSSAGSTCVDESRATGLDCTSGG